MKYQYQKMNKLILLITFFIYCNFNYSFADEYTQDIIYWSFKNGKPALIFYDLNKKEIKDFINIVGYAQIFDSSLKTSKFGYISFITNNINTNKQNLCIYDYNLKKMEHLEIDEYDYLDNQTQIRNYDWHPHQPKVFFIKNTNDTSGIYSYNMKSKKKILLYKIANKSIGMNTVRVSPTGKNLSFFINDSLYILSLNEFKVSGYPCDIFVLPHYCEWSNDGKFIVFFDARGNFYKFNIKTKQQKLLLKDEMGCNFLPNINTIIYLNYNPFKTNKSKTMMYNINSKSIREIENYGESANFEVSFDGKFIVFNKYENENFEIYIMKSNGTCIKRITRNYKDDLHPKWLNFHVPMKTKNSKP